MATASVLVVLSPATVVAGTGIRSPHKRAKRVKYITGLNSFGGPKVHNNITALGLPTCTEQSFAKIISSLREPSAQGRGRGGGALSSTCNVVVEIFRITAIMLGLVLVGVAVGFVLLRLESSLKEAE